MPGGAGIAHLQDGMSLLDYFAGQALAGDWAAQSMDIGIWSDDTADVNLESRARLYYRMAQAMIEVKAEEQA